MSERAEELHEAAVKAQHGVSMRPLTKREERFVLAYVRLAGDRYAALEEAGYASGNKESMRSAANKLLARPHVAHAISVSSGGAAPVKRVHHEAQRPEWATPIATSDEVLRFWTSTMRGETPPDRAKLRASEMLAKHLGLLVERGETAPPVIVNASSNDDGGGMRVTVQIIDNGRAPRSLLEGAAIDATPTGEGA